MLRKRHLILIYEQHEQGGSELYCVFLCYIILFHQILTDASHNCSSHPFILTPLSGQGAIGPCLYWPLSLWSGRYRTLFILTPLSGQGAIGPCLYWPLSLVRAFQQSIQEAGQTLVITRYVRLLRGGGHKIVSLEVGVFLVDPCQGYLRTVTQISKDEVLQFYGMGTNRWNNDAE